LIPVLEDLKITSSMLQKTISFPRK